MPSATMRLMPEEGVEMERNETELGEQNNQEGAFDELENYGPRAAIGFLSDALLEAEGGLSEEATKGVAFLLSLLSDSI